MLKQGRGRRPLAEHAISAPATYKALARESLTDHVMLAEIYCDHYEELSAYAQSILHSKERAEDAIQSAFARTLAALEEGRRIDHVDRWLHRCVRNACMDELRLLQVECESEVDDLPGSDDPAEITDWRDRCRHVYRAAGDLPEHLRTAFLLSEVRGLTYREIASEMERSVDSVRHLIFRARRHLNEMVGGMAKGLAVPALGFLSQERSSRGLIRRIHDILFLKMGEAHAHLADMIERPVRLAFSPALPLAVSVLVAGGMVDAGASGSVGRWPAVDKSGSVKTATFRGLDINRFAEPAVERISKADSPFRRGEVGSSPPKVSTQHRPTTPTDGRAGIGTSGHATDSPAGHGETQGEPGASTTAGCGEEGTTDTGGEDSPSGSGGEYGGAPPIPYPTSYPSPPDANGAHPDQPASLEVESRLAVIPGRGLYLSARSSNPPEDRMNLPGGPQKLPEGPETRMEAPAPAGVEPSVVADTPNDVDGPGLRTETG